MMKRSKKIQQQLSLKSFRVFIKIKSQVWSEENVHLSEVQSWLLKHEFYSDCFVKLNPFHYNRLLHPHHLLMQFSRKEMLMHPMI